MKNKGSFLAGMVTMLLIVALAVPAMASSGFVSKNLYYNNITVTLDGKPLVLQGDREPFVINGTTFLPVRAISETLGLDVDWDGASSTVILKSGTSQTSTAFSRLVSWITTNGANLGDGNYMFNVAPSSDMTYALFYEASSGTLTAAADNHGANGRAYSQVSFGDGSTTATVLYKYYTGASDAVETFYSRDTFSKAAFSESMVYSMTNASGVASDVLALHKNVAKGLCLSALDFIDLIYENEIKTSDTVASLGFTSHIKAVPSSTIPGQASRTPSAPASSSSINDNDTRSTLPSAATSEAAYQAEYNSITSYYSTQIKQLTQERDRAVENVKGQYASRTGGYENSAGAAAASAVAQQYNEKIQALEKERDVKITQLNAKYGR